MLVFQILLCTQFLGSLKILYKAASFDKPLFLKAVTVMAAGENCSPLTLIQRLSETHSLFESGSESLFDGTNGFLNILNRDELTRALANQANQSAFYQKHRENFKYIYDKLGKNKIENLQQLTSQRKYKVKQKFSLKNIQELVRRSLETNSNLLLPAQRKLKKSVILAARATYEHLGAISWRGRPCLFPRACPP